jgi:Family of unknown function (DUF5995)
VTEALDAVVARMAELLAPLEADLDPARFFLGTYLRTTQAVGAALDAGAFEDPAWVERWDADFAGLYVDALDAWRRDPAAPARPWRLAFGARADLPPEAHVLLGVNAHINHDLPQSLVRVIPPADFADPRVLARRRRDHERIDRVLAARVAAEDRELERLGDGRTLLDRLLAPANQVATLVFLREARRKVWANAAVLDAARRRGPGAYARRLRELESAAAERVADLLRPGPVLLRLAVRGFGVRLS